MRAFKRVTSRGFTLIELMIVVAIVGVLAALAIYGVRKYLLNAKTSEAKNSLGQMAKDAKAAYERESMETSVLTGGNSTQVTNNLCDSATATIPAAIGSVKGAKYQSTAAEWAVDDATATTKSKGFACLKFAMSDPQYYMYEYIGSTGTAGTFKASAYGDLTGDSVTSTFSIEGALTAGVVYVAPSIKEVAPEE